jgi:DNA ligase (NAD+)
VTDDQRADLLEEAISILDNLFHVLDEPCILPIAIGNPLGFELDEEVTNSQYDKMRKELETLRPDSDVFKKVHAGKIEQNTKKVKHDPPLTSISKASHEDRGKQEEQLFDWLAKCVSVAPGVVQVSHYYDLGEKTFNGRTELERMFKGRIVAYPRNYFYMEYKLDGVAVAVYYEKGKLVKAGLRPRDGINGEDVTEQIKYVKGVPLELREPLTCSARGEIICRLSDFAQVQKSLTDAGEELRANPRNHAAGGIRQFKNPPKVEQMKLSFLAYTIEGIDNPPWKNEIERAKYCNQKLGLPFVRCESFNFYNLSLMEEKAKGLDYQTDGVVIGIDDLDQQYAMGRHGDPKTGNPKGKIAWKFAEERAKPPVKDIEWNTGRGGSTTPVAIFEGVALAGTMVRRATLHNLGFMIRNQIGLGTVIIVLKAGNIIPKVVGVVSGQVADVIYPKVCPSCGSPTRILHTPGKNGADDMYDLLCDNHLSCSAQQIGGLLHYLAVFGVLGLGESRITQLTQAGVVKKSADFYKLTEKNCIDAGMSERQALLALASIHMIQSPDKIKDNDKLRAQIEKQKRIKKTVSLWKLFASFGIDTAGKSCGKALVDRFNTFDTIRSATADELGQVQDVGAKTAQIVYDYLIEHGPDIDDLLNFVEPESPKVGPLSGKTFVLTGGFPQGKKYWENEIENRGGKCASSVGRNGTDFVVEGTDAGEKAEKAKKYGIPLISLDQLKNDYLK